MPGAASAEVVQVQGGVQGGDPGEGAPEVSTQPWRRQVEVARPPKRPGDFTPHDLRFTPQKATRWFSPKVLLSQAAKVGVTSVFGSFLDKRELQTTLPCAIDERYSARDELWLDYVADTGDGFEATATLAHHVAQPTLRPPGVDRDLPRGDLLVLGGDEVYPSASYEGYENKLEGPWRAVLPWTEPVEPTSGRSDDPHHPSVYAIPGNHDWYDGLTGFLRLFGQGRWLGGWRTHQTRSYFAVRLPQRWWLWGVDIQSDALIDEPQLAYFAWAAAMASPGDRLVLATAVPTWTQLDSDPDAYHNLAYLERTLIRPREMELVLTLSGDIHHYARYAHTPPAPDHDRLPGDGPAATEDEALDEIGPAHKITSGGGGAFLHPTHQLPARTTIGVDPDDPDDLVDYELVTRYPSCRRSRWLALRAVLLPFRNPSFTLVPAVLSAVLLWTVVFGLRSLDDVPADVTDAAAGWGWTDLAGGLFRNSLSGLIVLLLFVGLWAFAEPPRMARRAWTRWTGRFALGAAHLGAQVVVLASVALGALAVAEAAGGGLVFKGVATLVAFVGGGLACSLVVGLYLALSLATPGIEAHANEAFASARMTEHKNFLRLHIRPDGGLTVYAVGIDRSVKRRNWRAVPDAPDEASWIAPTRRAAEPRLIDRVDVGPRPAAPAPAPAPAPTPT